MTVIPRQSPVLVARGSHADLGLLGFVRVVGWRDGSAGQPARPSSYPAAARAEASYVGPSGVRHNAPGTFRTRADANRGLALVEADLSRGTWVDDRAALVTVGAYARAVLRDSPKIGARWRETCERNLRLHLAPLLDVPLRGLTPTRVREWYAAALRGPGGRTTIAQSYRFLRMVMNTAVREGLMVRNPCLIPGAGVVRAAERPVASPAQAVALV